MSKNIEHSVKISKTAIKMLKSPKERKFFVVLFQKKRILKKLPVHLTVKGGKVKTSVAYYEATHKCYVSQVVLYIDKTPGVTFTFSEPIHLSNSESLTTEPINLHLNLSAEY